MSHQQAQHKLVAPATSLQDQSQTSKMRREIDIFTDAEHNHQDKAVHKLLSYHKLDGNSIEYILDVIVHISHERLELPEDLTQLEKDVPDLRDCIVKSLQTGSYRNIRNLPQLHKSLPRGESQVSSRDSNTDTDSASKRATERSWQRTFVGDSAMTLHKIIQSFMIEDAYPRIYARYAILAQSSGTGKSRMIDELARHILCIPVNLSKPGQGFPPRDVPAAGWFKEKPTTRELCEKRSQAFLYGLLVQVKLELESLEKEIPLIGNGLQRLSSLASKFRDKMSDGMTFDTHGPYRQLFYENVLKGAEEFMASTSTKPNVASPSLGYVLQGDGQARGVRTAADELLQYLDANASNETLTNPLAVFCFDESDVLTQPGPDSSWTQFSELRRALRLLHQTPIFAVFLSTKGKFHQFAPEPWIEKSNRLANFEMGSLPPIVEVGFDMLAEKVSVDGTWDLDQLASTHHICHLGRPLFATRYDKGDNEVKGEILRFAQEKLLCTLLPATAPARRSLFPDEALACLAVRLSLEFKATAWLDREKERTQVERHMRLCLFASPGFQNMVTVGPSEPLLAEAACQIMKGGYVGLVKPDVVKTLLDHLKSSHLETGLRGELIAELLLLLARDKACKGRPKAYHADPESGHKRDGQWRIITVPEFLEALLNEGKTSWKTQIPFVYHTEENAEKPLSEAFADCHIWFNHFIKVTHYDVINQEYLWRLLTRGAAIVCATSQAGVDIIIPFLSGKKLLKENVSAILIQVKNDKRFTTNIRSSLFTAMNPFSVGLFAAKVEMPPPVIRMVFALASPSSTVTHPRTPKRRSSRLSKATGAFTAYDIWCAGAVSETFGVIDGVRGNQDYADLLRHSQTIQTTYTVQDADHEEVREASEACVELRRMMAPGTSIERQHFANYTSDVVAGIELLDEEELESDYSEDGDRMVVDQQQ